MTYVCKAETPYLIAKKFGISPQAPIAANPRIKIYPGQVLTIPVPPPPTPHPQTGWCTLLLTPLHPKCQHGFALVNQSVLHIMVAADMPAPSSLTDCDVYTVWVMEETEDPVVIFWFDLLPLAGTGFRINHYSPRVLPMSGYVLVTAENMVHPAHPGGIIMLHGDLSHCCRYDP